MSLKKQDIMSELDITTDPVIIESLSTKLNAVQRLINQNFTSIETLSRIKQNITDNDVLTFIDSKISQLQTEINDLL